MANIKNQKDEIFTWLTSVFDKKKNRAMETRELISIWISSELFEIREQKYPPIDAEIKNHAAIVILMMRASF